MPNVAIQPNSFIEGRGRSFCRGCLGKNLFSGLNLGELPIANELLTSSEDYLEKFPLHLSICNDCGLGQVADVVTPERIFRDYRYLSSMSTTFLKHASDFVTNQVESGLVSPGDWVLEIASNDGYLLKNFSAFDIKTIGVEPAENVARISRSLGINTVSEFFSSSLARELVLAHGFPRLVIANNVMAHVPDLVDFFKGLATLSGPDTKISIENPSLSNILVDMQFDTIYHEHYSYLSAYSVARISALHGLSLFEIDKLSIHGGSNRYWLKCSDQESRLFPSVELIIENEIESGLFNPVNWENYSYKVSHILDKFLDWLLIGGKTDKRIYGYGAAAKASTILNSINFDKGLIRAIADVSLEKQQRFMPPHGIEIISLQQMMEREPTDIIIFPWNIKVEIASLLREIFNNDVRLWCVIPEIHEVH